MVNNSLKETKMNGQWVFLTIGRRTDDEGWSSYILDAYPEEQERYYAQYGDDIVGSYATDIEAAQARHGFIVAKTKVLNARNAAPRRQRSAGNGRRKNGRPDHRKARHVA
jgi:hypothetical protein